MALAGSSGGSWSTGLSHKPKSKNTSDSPYKLGQMYEGGSSRETPFLTPEFRARPGGYQAISGACQRIFTQPGNFILNKIRYQLKFELASYRYTVD